MKNNVREWILETFDDEEILFVNGFDDAIVGIDHASLRVIYDVQLMFMILIEEGMDSEDARDHLDFNILNAFVGDNTPIYMLSQIG